MPEPAPLADESFHAPVLSSEVVYEGRVWDVRRDVVDYDGGSMVREYVDHTGAVAVLALDDVGRVLLIKQYRHPIRSRDWELPAGLLDVPGEAPVAAARRELAEEADVEADTWNVLVDLASTPGGNNEVIRIYLARGVRSTGTVFDRYDEEADIEVRWVDLDEVVQGVLERRLRNAPLAVAALAASAARVNGFATLGAADLPFERGSSLQRALRPHERASATDGPQSES